MFTQDPGFFSIPDPGARGQKAPDPVAGPATMFFLFIYFMLGGGHSLLVTKI
jgi:hypothetical protein